MKERNQQINERAREDNEESRQRYGRRADEFALGELGMT